MRPKSTKNESFFQKIDKSSVALLPSIEAACEGLVFLSETDAPLLPFVGDPTREVGREIILHQTGANADEPVEEVGFGQFFGRLTAIKDWFGEPEKARAKKFLRLQLLLEENLRQLKVFRIGKIRIRIYAVGIDTEGRLSGVTTEAVET